MSNSVELSKPSNKPFDKDRVVGIHKVYVHKFTYNKEFLGGVCNTVKLMLAFSLGVQKRDIKRHSTWHGLGVLSVSLREKLLTDLENLFHLKLINKQILINPDVLMEQIFIEMMYLADQKRKDNNPYSSYSKIVFKKPQSKYSDRWAMKMDENFQYPNPLIYDGLVNTR